MIPPEIVDHILSFLQDRACLKICARAHPSISVLVDKYLYADISVQNYNSPKHEAYRTYELFKLLHDNPHIAKYVRRLNIYLHVIGTAWIRLCGFTTSFTGEYDELCFILPMLTKLEAVSLSPGRNPLHEHIDWHDLLESFRSSFALCIQLPTLTNVQISSVNSFPLSILDSSRSLQTVSLAGDMHYSLSDNVFTLPSLDNLILSDCSSPQSIACWAMNRGVRGLSFQDDFRSLPKLLEVCADTLTTLTIYLASHSHYHSRSYLISNHSAPFNPVPFSFASAPSKLRKLVIHTSISFKQHFWVNSTSKDRLESRLSYSCLPAIMQLLSTLPSPPAELVLLLINVDIELDLSFDDISGVDWSPLLSFPHYDDMHRVELIVRAKKLGVRISSAKLQAVLEQDRYLAKLEKYPSFVVTPYDLD